MCDCPKRHPYTTAWIGPSGPRQRSSTRTRRRSSWAGQALGKALAETAYSDTTQVLSVTDDNGRVTTTAYDTANRRSVITDAAGNTLTIAYDANSNVISITEVEKSDLGNPDETFVIATAYDNLDRIAQVVDNVGNIHRVGLDSRNNQTVGVDALGNETRSVYDGRNRLTSTIRDLDSDGADGDGPDIVTAQGWDDTSRLIGQTDANGNATVYGYDALNRRATTTYADGAVHSITFDVHDNALTNTDANGSVVTNTYDLLNRVSGNSIVPGPGVSSDTTLETYEYDGLSRLTSAQDDDSLVTRSYDSLSRVTRETLNGETTTCVYDGVGNMLSRTYPGGRAIQCTFDELDRKQAISDTSGAIATYAYIGPGRVERREYGNGTRTDYEYDGIANGPGDFGVKRIVATRHSKISDGSAIDDRTYSWDRMYNKVQREDVRAGGPLLTHDYDYDSIYRLIETTVNSLAKELVRSTTYALDGVGNRMAVEGAPDPGTYRLETSTPEPADFQTNQYTSTPFDNRHYDRNGNLVLMTAETEVGVKGPAGATDLFAFQQCYSALGDPLDAECEGFDSDNDGDIDPFGSSASSGIRITAGRRDRV